MCRGPYNGPMAAVFQFTSPPHTCGYLPDRQATLEYEYHAIWSAAEYEAYVAKGWRRFGHAAFHPVCAGCRACQPIRVVVGEFAPNRSQRRAWQANEHDVTVRIGAPSITRSKLDLHYRYHAFQADFKGWPAAHRRDVQDYAASFVDHPFPTEEWCFYLANRLVGVGYVDALPQSLSAIYFYYDPDERHRSLGTYNVLSVLNQARRRGLPHVHLGYFVAGCRSMGYKATFVPNEVLGNDGQWRAFRSRES